MNVDAKICDGQSGVHGFIITAVSLGLSILCVTCIALRVFVLRACQIFRSLYEHEPQRPSSTRRLPLTKYKSTPRLLTQTYT